MGLDSIVFYSTAAGTGAALAPTSAVIKGNSGDAYIVGMQAGPVGTDNTTWTLTCAGDARWEAGGITKLAKFTDSAANLIESATDDIWLPTKVPVKCGATLTCVSNEGADDTYCVIYVDYPQFGEAFKIREPAVSQPVAFEITKTLTAGAALTAFTIAANSTNNATFQRGKAYTPVRVEGNYAGTTPFFIGIQNTKFNLATYWLCRGENIATGNRSHTNLPYGMSTVDGGETAFFHFLSTTADTPIALVTYAYA